VPAVHCLSTHLIVSVHTVCVQNVMWCVAGFGRRCWVCFCTKVHCCCPGTYKLLFCPKGDQHYGCNRKVFIVQHLERSQHCYLTVVGILRNQRACAICTTYYHQTLSRGGSSSVHKLDVMLLRPPDISSLLRRPHKQMHLLTFPACLHAWPVTLQGMQLCK
jgi:hypothetical protein